MTSSSACASASDTSSRRRPTAVSDVDVAILRKIPNRRKPRNSAIAEEPDFHLVLKPEARRRDTDNFDRADPIRLSRGQSRLARAPYRRSHNASLTTACAGRPGASSAGRNSRPARAFTPSSEKKFPETCAPCTSSGVPSPVSLMAFVDTAAMSFEARGAAVVEKVGRREVATASRLRAPS